MTEAGASVPNDSRLSSRSTNGLCPCGVVSSGVIETLSAVCRKPSGTLASGESKINPIKFSDTRLDNGLRLIAAEDHYAPVYAIALGYAVGSKDERPGRTGFAHLFEHRMFKGSENVGAGEHFFPIFN